jgi:2-polyprenyl-6-methoxyphenol hydroxylase-like FAD-dependent oxidoreductase
MTRWWPAAAPSGLGIALGLARRGVKVLLAGAAAQVRDDGRTAALMQPSVAFLEDIGVAQRLTERATRWRRSG